MSKLMIACLAAAGLCGLSAIANAAPADSTTAASIASSTTSTIADLPYTLAKLQGEVQSLQTEVQNLQGLERQDDSDPQYFFSVVPPPNPDGSPIPSGG
jgi:peptidoglycan hydrolase CwlO-like protein